MGKFSNENIKDEKNKIWCKKRKYIRYFSNCSPICKDSVSSFAACAKPFNPGGTPHMKGGGCLSEILN